MPTIEFTVEELALILEATEAYRDGLVDMAQDFEEPAQNKADAIEEIKAINALRAKIPPL